MKKSGPFDLRYYVMRTVPGGFDEEKYGFADGLLHEAYGKLHQLRLDEKDPTAMYWLHDAMTGNSSTPMTRDDHDRLLADVDAYIRANLSDPTR